MAKTTTKDPGKRLKRYNDLIAGLNAAAPGGVSEIAVAGTSYTIAALVAKLTLHRDLFAAVVKAEAALTAAVQAREAEMPQAGTFLGDACRSVKAAMGRTNPDLSKYGLKQDKEPQPMTAEQLVERNAKSAATRKARGTLGPKQKAKITGAPAATPAKQGS